MLRACLEDLQEAVRSGQRHGSYDPWRLLFILKKGRDRYDLKKGCGPIVCLAHMLCLDEGMVQSLLNRHVNAIRTDINIGYRARATLTQIPFYHREQQSRRTLLWNRHGAFVDFDFPEEETNGGFERCSQADGAPPKTNLKQLQAGATRWSPRAVPALGAPSPPVSGSCLGVAAGQPLRGVVHHDAHALPTPPVCTRHMTCVPLSSIPSGIA